jgi:hypothetical protein
VGYERRKDHGGPISFVVDAEADLATIVNPQVGQLALALAEGSHWYHTGSVWAELSGTGGGGAEAVSFSLDGNVSTGTGAHRWYNDTGAAITLVSARGTVGTAPVGATMLIDINNNGTSVWDSTQANRITIADGGFTDEGGAFDDATVADGEYITVDVDQVGSGTAGADLVVTIWYTA